jgi:hypothetical protein
METPQNYVELSSGDYVDRSTHCAGSGCVTMTQLEEEKLMKRRRWHALSTVGRCDMYVLALASDYLFPRRPNPRLTLLHLVAPD